MFLHVDDLLGVDIVAYVIIVVIGFVVMVLIHEITVMSFISLQWMGVNLE